MRNRALTDTFEPGSTMKPFIAALALESGRVTPDTVIQTAPGRINVTGSTITDAHPHGALTVNEVIQKSSNVGTVKMAMQMQPREMWEMFTQVGFGRKPDINFPGAVTGRLRPYKSWRPIEQATMSFGYGLSTSLFQLARSYGAFAHDGELLQPSLLKDSIPGPGVRVMSPETAQQVRHMLALATGKAGTAPKAQTMGYSVGGKTGTAHKQEGGVYVDKKYRSWFVGMAPISQAAHHRRGDARRTEQRQVLWWRRGRTGVQRSRATKPARARRGARPGREVAGRRRPGECGRGKLLMALQPLATSSRRAGIGFASAG